MQRLADLETSWETTGFAGQRLDVFLAQKLERSRNFVQSLIDAERILITPAPSRKSILASYKLRTGEIVLLSPAAGSLDPDTDENREPGQGEGERKTDPLGNEKVFAETPTSLEIMFEDEALLVINKPPGLVVHPAAGHPDGTLVDALLQHCPDHLARRGGENRLGIVHRLDKNTSGAILVAKTDLAHERLSSSFAQRAINKWYRALVWGRMRLRQGSCLGAIGRHPIHRKKMALVVNGGRAAQTDYRTLEVSKRGSEVECRLHTGRTHQARVHLAGLGHPIWGDTTYGRRHPLKGFFPARQMLHAFRIEFTHPLSKASMSLTAPLPADYLEAKALLLADD